jgi:hypothetical protein
MPSLEESLAEVVYLQRQEAAERRKVQACAAVAEDRNSELCAQWKAADAARLSAILALVSAVVSGASLFGIFVTFNETRKTAKAAIDGVEQARRSATVAEKALIGLERPWLIPDASVRLKGSEAENVIRMFQEGDVDPRPLVIEYRLNLQNQGRIPAVIKSYDLQILGALSHPELFQGMTFARVGERVALGPVDGITAVLQMTKLNRENLMRNAPALIARVCYSDQLGVERELGFSFRMRNLWTNEVEWHGGDALNYDRLVQVPLDS